MGRIFLKSLSIFMAAMILFAYPASANEGASSSTGASPHNAVSLEAASNVDILNAFFGKLDPNASCAITLQYDDQKRITRITAVGDESIVKVENIVYNTDNTYHMFETTENKAEYIAANHPQELSRSVVAPLSSGDGFYNEKISDTSVDDRINKARGVWTEANRINYELGKYRAHIEANVARADFCVVYPKSNFAKEFLGAGGNLIHGTGFRRILRDGLVGNDVIAVQRALMAYGSLDPGQVPADDYGNYGPSTVAAVKDFQQENGLKADGEIGPNTIKAMFNPGSIDNKGATGGFPNLHNISIYQGRHDTVVGALQKKVTDASTVDTFREAYLARGGRKENGGRADLIKKDVTNANYVWEVKPDSPYGWATGQAQVNSYVKASKYAENLNHEIRREYCPLKLGYSIPTFTVPWSGKTLYAYSNRIGLPIFEGVVFYSDNFQRFNFQPVLEKAESKELVKDYKLVTYPEPAIVQGGLAGLGVAFTCILVVAGTIALGWTAPGAAAAAVFLLIIL